MIWLIFKKCCKKKNKPVESNDSNQVENPKEILREVLPKLDMLDDINTFDDNIYILDKHFEYLSIVNPYLEVSESIPEITDQDVGKMNNPQNNLEDTLVINNRCTKVTEKQLNSLQCPFTWNFESNVWNKNVINCIENKYGKFNMEISVNAFSLERFTSNLIVGCILYKMNAVDKAHDKLIRIWEWLDKLDNSDNSFYLAIREGLKHVMMSTLCHILNAMDRYECRQLFEMITPFNNIDSKSKAAIYAIRAAVCIEIGGKELENIVQYAKRACELDPDTAQWHYLHSLAMTAQRQYLHTNKSCPTEAEFDAIQHAIVLANKPNAYFNFHRMILMTNKMFYYHRHRLINNGSIINNKNENSSEKMKENIHSVIELIKAIIAIESGDPHLVVKCAKSIITMPYLNQDDIYLAKQIIKIAITMAHNDTTVIRAIEKVIEMFKELVRTYKIMNEHKTYLESAIRARYEVKEKENNSKDDSENKEHKMENDSNDGRGCENDSNNKECDFENDLKLIVQKNKNGRKPVLDLIQLLEKYDGIYRWKIMAQICSYTILFKDSVNLLVSVEQFLMLIHDRSIANSDIIKKHRSIFIEDDSKIFNLAELVCNEIKLVIIHGSIKKQDQIQFCLDQLTKIMEVCQIQSKNVNPSFKSELIGCQEEEKQNALNKNNVVNQKNKIQNTNKTTSKKKCNKPRRIKQSENVNSSNYRTRVFNSRIRKTHNTVL